MTSLLQIQLQNTKERYETLAKQGRKDLIAAIVLNRIQDEINTFERRISNEEKPRRGSQVIRHVNQRSESEASLREEEETFSLT